METKKISFGFSKIKKGNLTGSSAIVSKPQPTKEKIELISCLEGQAIKIVGKENEDEPAPLVIPLREQDKTTIPDRLAKLQDIFEGRDAEENGAKKVVEAKTVSVGSESLEQRAAREILEDLQEQKSRTNEKNTMVVPLKPEDLPLEGGRASTMDDYESVPIEQFGLAMLRGMGWKEDPNAPKKDDRFPEGPIQRPKGMGLGAERMSKDKNRQLIPPAKDEVLVMKKGAFVKVLAGKHKGSYGMVESLDEENARVVVRFSIGGGQESLNEYLLQLVSNAEYKKYSKVLNNTQYEEFKSQTAGTSRAVKEESSTEPEQEPSSSSSYPQASLPAKSYRSPDTRDDDRGHEDRPDSEEERRHERRSRSQEDQRQVERHRHRHTSSSDDSDDSGRGRQQHRHKSHFRTSSGTKKKSHKYKQRRDYSRERHRGHAAEGEERHHKKKTKKSKKQRSRSRSRR